MAKDSAYPPELERLIATEGGEVDKILRRLIEAKLSRALGGDIRELLDALAERLRVTQQLSALYGARETISAMDEALARLARQAMTVPTVRVGAQVLEAGERLKVAAQRFVVDVGSGKSIPRVPFDEAIRTVLKREPRLAPGWRATQQVFTEQRAFALAKSVDLKVTQRIQQLTVQALREGRELGSITEQSAALGDWSRAYAETVHRTNATTAYSDGRFIQTLDPDVRAVIPALMVIGPRDADARPNHVAFIGLVAAPDDPIWIEAKPPYGYNCRHGLRPVDVFEAKQMRILDDRGDVIPFAQRATLPRGAHRDPGFAPTRAVA